MTIKIGIAQINPTSGDFENNAKKIAKYICRSEKESLDMLVFPVYALTGLLTESVLKRHPFLIDEINKWLTGLSKLSGKTAVILYFIEHFENENVYKIAICKNKKIIKVINDGEVININGINCGISSEINIDETAVKLKKARADILIYSSKYADRNNLSQKRKLLLKNIAKSNNFPLIYINQVGATDCMSFDGRSMLFNKNGNIISQAKSFDEDFIIVEPFEDNKELKLPDIKFDNNKFSLDYDFDMERTYNSLVQGTRDYFKKCKLKRAVIGLSGGLDSSVCAVIVSDAIGKENVLGVSMPSKITSNESKNDAKVLANNLGIHFIEQSIKPFVDISTDNFENMFEKIQRCWTDRLKESYTQDNIQARARAIFLFGISNEFPSCIPIATSDKSEAYMGYATINGDMSGGFAPIADVTKTKLFALAKWMNNNRKNKNAIPESVILKKPGAELAINPDTGETLKAEEALMPYEFLDEVIWRIENKNESFEDMLNSKFLYEKKHSITQNKKIKWLEKFYARMSRALNKWILMPTSIITDEHSINCYEYRQPVTSCNINFKSKRQEEIDLILNTVAF